MCRVPGKPYCLSMTLNGSSASLALQDLLLLMMIQLLVTDVVPDCARFSFLQIALTTSTG